MEKAGADINSGWCDTEHVMANGNDFLSQLRKGVMSLPTEVK